MKILGQICTLNDEDVIERSVGALLAQTRPLDEILIVDNGSSDGTVDRAFPQQVRVIRHGENLGTSGGALTALRYGLDHGYDWVWTFDADSAPRPDALERLLDLHQSFEPEFRSKVWILACLPIDVASGAPHHGLVFTKNGYGPVAPAPDQRYYQCDMTIWSGSLFRCAAVRDIGLPHPDYVVDWGENEYGYRGMKKGYRAFVHQDSVMDHNIGGPGGPHGPREELRQIGPLKFRVPLLSPFRLYYIYRNMTYFFLYEYFRGNILRFFWFARWMPRHIVKLALAGRFSPEIRSCLRGLSDGFRKKMHNRY